MAYFYKLDGSAVFQTDIFAIMEAKKELIKTMENELTETVVLKAFDTVMTCWNLIQTDQCVIRSKTSK